MTTLAAWMRAVRVAVVHVLYGLGVLQLLTYVLLRHRAVVLMYHRVLPRAAQAASWSHPAIVISPDTFDLQMRLLRRYLHVVTPERFRECLDRGRFDARSCLVTFDDGWIDTYDEAWKVLRRHQIPALVFLPSAYIGTGEVFWQERLGRVLHAIWRRAQPDASFAAQARTELARFDLDGVLDFDAASVRDGILTRTRLRKADVDLDPTRPIRALLRLVPEVAGPSDVDQFINWEQAREMAHGGVTFGAHGDTHRRLTTLPSEQLRREIETSRDALARGLGQPAVAFCYPNGDWNTEVAAAVAQGEFTFAFSTQRGHIAANSNRFALRRMNIHEDMTRSAPMFLGRILGLL